MTQALHYAKFVEHARRLVGQKCLRAGLSYAGQPVLHFGEPVPYKSKKLAGKSRGTWVLETFGTPWLLDAPTPSWRIITGLGFQKRPPAPLELESQLSNLAEARVSDVVIDLCDIAVVFDAGLIWATLSRYGEQDKTLPVWELLVPGRKFLRVVGPPNPTFWMMPSNQPVDQWGSPDSHPVLLADLSGVSDDSD